MRRVVLDCNVVLQSLLRDSSPSFTCLSRIESQKLRIQISKPILAEYQDVLNRPVLRNAFPILTPEYVESKLEILVQKCDWWDVVSRHVTYLRDPKDEPYLNLAIESDAHFLVSRDHDLLLAGLDPTVSEAIRNVMICDPIQFLRILDAIR